jgi:hypothetical protein
MAIKTISLELDAYERLRRGRESFSAVVRRARFDPAPSTGASILAELERLAASGRSLSPKTFEYWDRVRSEERASGAISPSHWGT